MNSGAQPALDETIEDEGDVGTNLADELTAQSVYSAALDSPEEEFAPMSKRVNTNRKASPVIVINKNGSRYIAPIDIVRSAAGRAEILRQRRPRQIDEAKRPAMGKAVGARRRSD